MDVITLDDMRTLLEHRDQPCVSIYFPTHKQGRDTMEDGIRLRNMTRQCHRMLVEQHGFNETRAREFIDPVASLPNEDFWWSRRGDGIAIFRAPTIFRYFRLPLALQNFIYVNSHFHLKPLVPLFTENGLFYILALSEEHPKLYLATLHAMQEVNVPRMPANIHEIVMYDVLQKEMRVPNTRGSQRAESTILHGHGNEGDPKKENHDLQQFTDAIATSVGRFLDAQTAPMVLAGTELITSTYKDKNSYNGMIDHVINGNPESIGQDRLHSQACQAVKPHLEAVVEKNLDYYANMTNTERVSNQIQQLVPSALDGRIRTLFVDTNMHQWGTYDRDNREVTLHDQRHPGDEDLIDLAAVWTLLNDGMVFAVPKERLDENSPIAGIFRY